ncbi:hypothetical protein Sjap_008623 [Stephania japonica]|uniref:Uncharacterized protein n=1 Tax=Stephania japonica TaxID=461633 RepID=A0AAP0JQC7_9MAGN
MSDMSLSSDERRIQQKHKVKISFHMCLLLNKLFIPSTINNFSILVVILEEINQSHLLIKAQINVLPFVLAKFLVWCCISLGSKTLLKRLCLGSLSYFCEMH